MSLQKLAYKYRFYPTGFQKEILEKTFGCIRLMWNLQVDKFNNWKQEGPHLGTCSIKELKQVKPWLKEVPYNALEQKLQDWIEFKKQFFNKKRKLKIGRPQFKKKSRTQSFRLNSNGFKIKENQFIELAKMGRIDVRFDRPFINELTKKVCSVTVSRDSCDEYYISVLVEEEKQILPNTGRSIGIDLGLIDLCVLSDGTKISNPKWFRKSQSELGAAQRKLARKEIGSGRRERGRLKVAQIYKKVSNQRSWFHHNLSTWLVKNYDVIAMENLNIAGMKKNRKLAKSISDAGWTGLVNMIKYKSVWYGRGFVQVDRFYASSKTCSDCGHVISALPLDIREWTCESCGSIHDRDVNAGMNIRRQGLMDLYGIDSGESLEHIRGEDVRPILDRTKVHPVLAGSMKRRDLGVILDTLVSI